MKELNISQKNEILAMQSWGTYREKEGAVQVFNPYNKVFENIQSFTIEEIPNIDAVFVFGGYPRVIKYAGEIAIKVNELYGKKPAFITVGGWPNKGQKVGKSEAEWFEEMMISLGFSLEWVLRYHRFCNSNNTGLNKVEFREILDNSYEFAGKRPKIAFITEAGYSLRAIQEFALEAFNCEFYVFETPQPSLKERLFDVEAFEGYFVDLTLANIFHAQMRWNKERTPLTAKKMETAPILYDIRKYVEMGYAFYFPYRDMFEAIGMDPVEGLKLVEARRIEITGTNLKGEIVGKGLHDDSIIFKEKQIFKMLDEIRADWEWNGLKPF